MQIRASPSFFSTGKIGLEVSEVEGSMYPFLRFSSMNSLTALAFLPLRIIGGVLLGLKSGLRWISKAIMEEIVQLLFCQRSSSTNGIPLVLVVEQVSSSGL